MSHLTREGLRRIFVLRLWIKRGKGMNHRADESRGIVTLNGPSWPKQFSNQNTSFPIDVQEQQTQIFLVNPVGSTRYYRHDYDRFRELRINPTILIFIMNNILFQFITTDKAKVSRGGGKVSVLWDRESKLVEEIEDSQTLGWDTEETKGPECTWVSCRSSRREFRL